MTWWQVVIAVVGAVLAPLLTYLAAKTSARNGAKTARTADWEGFAREQREWTEDRLAERDRRIEDLAKQVESRDQRIAAVESRLDLLEAKYRQAIAYIRRLVRQLQRHVEPDDIEAPPPEISPDL